MNESKFSLADLLIVLGALGFGFFCFLSLNFLSLGETSQSIIVATIIALILGGLAFGAKLLKKTSRNFKTCIIWEWILLFLFAVVALLAIFPFSHYFTVIKQKDEIQRNMTSNINQSIDMFARYEEYATNREDIYKSDLNSVVSAKNVNPSEYRDYGFVNGTPDKEQVENKMFTLHAQLFPTNYEGEGGIKEVATNWLVSAKRTLDNKWAFTFGIVDIVKDAKTNITDWNNKLIKFSSFKADGENAEDFKFSITYDDVTNKIKNNYGPSILTIVYALLFYLLMLMSYFISTRHTRYPGVKLLFGTSSIRENEL